MRSFIVAASILGLAYAFVTPPCYAPDEVAHFWRAASLAHGTWTPVDGRAPLPEGYQVFVFCLYRDLQGEQRLTRAQFTTAWSIDQRADKPVSLKVVEYHAANYLPQIAAALVGRITNARPMIVFYLGRVFALAAFIALVALAIRATPYLKWGFVAAGLLPMTLFMAASWSADAMTIALTFCATGLALRASRDVASPLVAFVLGMCKPGYFLVSAIGRRWLPLAAGVIGLLLARGVTGANAAQWQCIRDHPLRFLGILATDFATRGHVYAEQLVGRLGLLDVFLPKPAMYAAWLLLALIVITAGDKVPRAQRILALVVSFVLMIGVSVTLYVVWTPVCANTIEGIQGRYFLPLLPALMIGLSNPWWRRWRPGPIATTVVVLFTNLTGLHALASRYFFS